MEKRYGSGRAALPRPPLEWQRESFWNEERLLAELRRVFDICHGCRRCLALCPAFSMLFERVDESPTMRPDGLTPEDCRRVVEACHLCDLCYVGRCPYVPPHAYNVDFPHLMLRAKAVYRRRRKRWLAPLFLYDRLRGGGLYSGRAFHRFSTVSRRRLREGEGASRRKEVVMFITCQTGFAFPRLADDLAAVLRHNDIPVAAMERERCCGACALPEGDLDEVARGARFNISRLAEWVEAGCSILVLQPACLQVFRHWLPALFPDQQQIRRVAEEVLDPVEYLAQRHANRELKTDFTRSLGVVTHHSPCHLRAGVGDAGAALLKLVPQTHVEEMVACVGGGCLERKGREKGETREEVTDRIRRLLPDHCSTSCAVSARRLAYGIGGECKPVHPLSLLRKAYGL